MRVTMLSPGTGHYYCGSCLRDDSLARALREHGHDVTVAPLYLPFELEDAPDGAEAPVLMGGINVYLQHKVPALGRLPRWLSDRLDHPGLLRWAARRGGMTEPQDLGALAVSMVRGDDGRQASEIRKLIQWLKKRPAPDVLVLSNVMLCGLARTLRAELGCPIVVTLQGEAPFLDALPEPYASEAWAVLRERAEAVDRFVAVSRSYGDTVAERLGLLPDRVSVVYNGIDLSDFAAEPTPLAERRPPEIAYVARMCADKGLPTLIDAFVELSRRDAIPDLRLGVVGVMLDEDQALVDQQRQKLAAAGCADRVSFAANAPRADKLALLQRASVLSVPATYGESFGLYVLEALAAGVPVVQPRHGAFPELVEATGGGVLCAPDDAGALADALDALLADPARAAELGRRGRAAVFEGFSSERMAGEFETVCRMTARHDPGAE